MDLFVERVCHPVVGLGPGRRVAVWVQGCARRCPGCLSPELFQRRPESRMAATAVAHRVLACGPCDGLTISGGEPMDQADALHEMLNVLQRANEPEVLVYTGYTIEELRRAGGAPFRLLARIDILVDGPFIIERPSTLVWRGSDNQRVHLLTPRARQHAGAARRAWGPLRSMQYMLEPGGRLVVVGIPHRRFREDLASATARRGIDWEAR